MAWAYVPMAWAYARFSPPRQLLSATQQEYFCSLDVKNHSQPLTVTTALPRNHADVLGCICTAQMNGGAALCDGGGYQHDHLCLG